jgi:hypothetical protein
MKEALNISATRWGNAAVVQGFPGFAFLLHASELERQ